MVSEFCLATVEYMERFRQRDGLIGDGGRKEEPVMVQQREDDS